MDLSDEIQALLWPFLENQEPQCLQDIGFDAKVPQGMMHQFVPSSSFEEYQSGKQEIILDGTLIPYGEAEQRNDYVVARKGSKAVDDDSLMPEGLVKKVNPKALRGKFPGCCNQCLNQACNAPGVRRSLRSKVEAQRCIEKNGIASTGCSTGASNQQQNGGALPPQTDGKQIAEAGADEK